MLYALDHNVERLAEDHARAKRLAAGARTTPACRSTSARPRRTSSASTSPRSGVDPGEAQRRIAEQGVAVGMLRPGVLRVATHLDVTDDDVDRAIELDPAGTRCPRCRLTGLPSSCLVEDRCGDRIARDQRRAAPAARSPLAEDEGGEQRGSADDAELDRAERAA